MPTVLLVTFNLMPEGEPGHAALSAALAERGVDSRWVCWDDPSVDWAAADVVAVRSTWDYHRRLPAFLAWARAVDRAAPMLNGPTVFEWNADKAYLAELAGELPVVPTTSLEDDQLVPGLAEAIERWGTVVVKPRVSARGDGVVVASAADDPALDDLNAGPWVVQPLVESVRTSGESSVYVIDGRAVAQVDKFTSGDEIRVHEHHGGSSRPAPLDADRARVAEHVVLTVARRLDADLSYARVDLMEWEGAWVVSELELIEPGLYLDVDPGIAQPFADLVAARAGR